MSIYSDNLAHVQVIINCPYSVAHLCTNKATLAYNLGALHFDDVMSYNSLSTSIAPSRMLIGVGARVKNKEYFLIFAWEFKSSRCHHLIFVWEFKYSRCHHLLYVDVS